MFVLRFCEIVKWFRCFFCIVNLIGLLVNGEIILSCLMFISGFCFGNIKVSFLNLVCVDFGCCLFVRLLMMRLVWEILICCLLVRMLVNFICCFW